MAQSVILVAQATSSSTAADAVQNGTVINDAASQASTVSSTVQPEEATPGFPPFDASTFPSQLLWFAITFIVLYVVLSRAALPQISGIIERRKARIDGDLKEAERLKGETDKAISAYETALADARKNAHAIAEETRASIKADIDAKRKGAHGARAMDQRVIVARAVRRHLAGGRAAIGVALRLNDRRRGQASSRPVAVVAEAVRDPVGGNGHGLGQGQDAGPEVDGEGLADGQGHGRAVVPPADERVGRRGRRIVVQHDISERSDRTARSGPWRRV